MRNLKTLLLFLFLISGTSSFTQTTFSLSSSSISCGENTCLQVTSENFDSILSFQFSMNWDAAILGNAQVQTFGIADLNTNNFNLSTPGIARIGWDDSNTIGLSLPASQVLFEICFDVIGNTTTSSNVTFSANPIPTEVVNHQGDIINTLFEDGTVRINCDTMDGGNDDEPTDSTSELTFIASNASINCGEQTCIDITVQGFRNISSFQYSMNWDADLLGTASVKQFGLSDMNENQFNVSTPGVLRVGYDDSSLAGMSLADNALLYQICFDTNEGIAGNSDILFSNIPISIEAVDLDVNILNPAFQNGTVTIACDTMSNPIDTIDNPVDTIINELPFGFTVATDTANCGEQICVDVSVQGFTDITFFRYSLSWDFNLLGQEVIPQSNLAGIRFGPIAPGSFWSEWRSPNGQGVTLADNEVIYQLCFDIPGNVENRSTVEFTNVPIPIFATNSTNQSLQPNLQAGAVEVTCVPIDTSMNDIADSLSFALTSTTANCGEQTCLDVIAQDFHNIFSFQYSIAYDATALGTVSIQNFGLNDLNASNFNIATPGIIRVGWDDATLEGRSLPDDLVLYQVCFDTDANTAGDIEVLFSGNPLAIEVADVDGNIIIPEFQNGMININCDTIPVDTMDTTPTNFVLSLADGNVDCGEQVCLDVTTQDFKDIVAFQYSMTWDTAVLENASVQNFGLIDLGNGNFNTATPGILRVGWTDPAVAGITLADETTLYQICFDAKGISAATTEIAFSGNPLAIEVMDANDEILDAQFENGMVQITCATTPIDTSDTIGDELTFILSETSGNCGEQVCMDVRVHNFTDILSFQYSINWDADLLGRASVQGFGMPDLNPANFNTNSPGVLRVGWDDTFITGVTLPDDQLIFQLCFDNITDSFSNEVITFSGTPTSIEVVDDRSNLIIPDFQNGNLSIQCDSSNNGGNETSELSFILSETIANCDEQICMDVSVKGFRNILSFQYSILWDASLGIATPQSYGLPDINTSNFNNNMPGVLRIGWDDTFITGASLPDDHIIYQICFDMPEEAIENALIRFSNTPTSIEVVDRDGNLLNPNFQNGSITANCNINLVDNDNDGFTNDVDCDDNNPIIYPGAMEFPNNGVDEDCDGSDLFIDADNDGFNSSIDCDDNNAAINGNAIEIPNNGIDEDCDGADLIQPVDEDNDGFAADMDCDDNNPNINPDATEIANNGIDEDCDGADLIQPIDEDNDGFAADVDCDDNNPNINPDATEIANNGIDEDCDGADLIQPIDADNDGFAADVDCDDNNPNINPDATEIANNGIDEDCDGADLIQPIDADNDGFAADVDCDDNNPNINPDATEIANNGIDEDCDGMDLIEVDSSTVVLTFSDATADCGEQICLNATVKNFRDLISFQYAVNWDTTTLRFAETRNYTLQGLSNTSFFTPENGVLRVSWFDVNIIGVSVADDAVLYQICFDVISDANTMTSVDYANAPIPIEIVDNQSMEMPVILESGNINITNCGGNIMGIIDTKTVDTKTSNHLQNILTSKVQKEDKSAARAIRLYPNPTGGQIYIQTAVPLLKNATVKIYNVSGMQLREQSLNQERLDISTLDAGLYLIEIQNGNTFFRERIIKK